MSPTIKLGGRPKNAWTASRKRKLVRLYTLTTLDKEEIRKVLKAHDFDPSSSDIQKKLRALFPRDYAKDYRKYRPSSRHQMSSRMNIVRSRRGGRGPRSKKSGASVPRDTPSYDTLASFEGPMSAFRSHANSDDTGTFKITKSLSDPLSGAELVDQSLLLLDGSMMPHTSTMHSHFGSPKTLQYNIDAQDQTVPLINCDTPSTRKEISAISTRSIEERLRRRSSSMIEHIHNVLRYSSSSSRRSTISLRISCSSSSEAGQSSYHGKAQLRSKPSSSSQPAGSLGLFRIFRPVDKLSESEESVWHELINENQFSRLRRRTYSEYWWYPMGMGCCEKLTPGGSAVCGDCGSLPIHRAFARPKFPSQQLCSTGAINGEDFFGNTSIHYAATHPVCLTRFLVRMISLGVNITPKNTLGQTFLHILFGHMKDMDNLPAFFGMLRHIADLGFHFGIRDVRGRTALHVLFACIRHLDASSLGIMEELFSIVDPQVDVMDNLGRTIGHYVYELCGNGLSRGRASMFLSTYSRSENWNLSFRQTVSEHFYHWPRWVGWVLQQDRFTWVDFHGDTALITLVGLWRHNDDDESLLPGIIQRLVSSGAEVDVRDRDGNTPLSIASARGLRPAVKKLLSLGASVHSRRYDGNSILYMAKRQLRVASRERDEKVYAMVLSCIVLLADYGVRMSPVRFQEWSTASSRIHDPEDSKAILIVAVLRESGFI